MIRLLTVFFIVFVSGCATMVPEEDIIDYDPESIERYERDGIPLEQKTPDHVEVANYENVVVVVHKNKNYYDEQEKVDRQVWNVLATNNNENAMCVGILWELMDFQYISPHPTDVLIPAYDTIQMGTMLQNVWLIDGVKVAPPASGYVKNMRIMPPVDDALPGEECYFMAPKDRIISK